MKGGISGVFWFLITMFFFYMGLSGLSRRENGRSIGDLKQWSVTVNHN